MSVNTPKRPKTSFQSGLCGESPVFGQTWPTDMLWPNAPPSVDSAVATSPSTSCCGSPETTMRTPSTTSGTVDMQSREPVQFPTPSTNTSGSNLDTTGGGLSSSGGREHKRGRPRSETLTNLMLEGSTSPSAIKCKYCYRVFPREKSLAAHLRTHTGERPYVCDYPGCTKSFTQSGQMKTHQRLHTGERPFICPVPACEMRFTHANRHCPVHVNAVLKRDDKFVVKMTPEQNEEVLQWLEKYRAEREDKSTPTRKTPQRSRSTPSSAGRAGDRSAGTPTPVPHQVNAEGSKPVSAVEDDTVSSTSSSSSGLKRHPQNDENECPVTPTTPSKNPYKSRKGLMVELDMNAGLAMSPLAPLKMKPQPKVIQWQEPTSQGEDDEDDDEDSENVQRIAQYYVSEKPQLTQSPKRLKEKENRNYSPSKRGKGNGSSTFNPKKKWLREACMEDLAKPLEGSGPGLDGSPRKLQIKSMNLLRPTVLMLASKDKQIPLNNAVAQAPATPPPPPPAVLPAPEPEPNRRWLGKMALMQLPTRENQPNAEVGFASASGLPGDLPEYTQL